MSTGRGQRMIYEGKKELMDEREEKLPKWAKEELKKLRRSNDVLRDSLKARAGLNEAKKVYAVSDPFGEDQIYLTEPQVKLMLGKNKRGRDVEVIVDIDQDQKVIKIRSRDGSLFVTPEASNSLQLRVGDLFRG